MEEDFLSDHPELRPFVLSDVQLTGTTIAPVRICVCLFVFVCVYAYLHGSLNKPIAGSEKQVASLATNSVANIKFRYKYNVRAASVALGPVCLEGPLENPNC